MNKIDPDVTTRNEQAQRHKHLEAVLAEIEVRLHEEQALSKEIDVLTHKVDALAEELSAKKDRRHQLRTRLQQELAAALYPIVEFEVRDSLTSKSGLGAVRDMQVINEVLNERCAKYLAELIQQS